MSDWDPRWTGHFLEGRVPGPGDQAGISTPHHPQTDGHTERINRELEEMLRTYVTDRQNGWDDILPLIEFAYSDSQQSSTHATPFLLKLRRPPSQPTGTRTCQQ